MTLTMAELAQALEARLWGDGAQEVHGAAEAGQAGAGQISLAMAPAYAEKLTSGSIAILAEGMDPEALGLKAAILVPRPRVAMAGLTRAFDRGPELAPGIHPSAVIDPSAEIPSDAAIGPFVAIGARVRIGQGARIASHVSIGRDTVIGRDATIHPGARIAHEVTIGDRVILHPGSSIGADGFSFVTPEPSGVEEIRHTLGERQGIREQHWTRIHSLGGVEIGDDVELGANSTIDRGTIRATRVGRGTKIDNQVQVGHNCTIGEDVMLCGLVGIAGSARIGNRVVLGGQVGVSDNIFVGDDVIAGGATKIFTNAPAGRVLLGSPAVKMETQVEAQKNIRRLPRLYAQVAELRETVKKLMEKRAGDDPDRA
ncbi:UDP-3-O-(3-hydroxymyristoyl)glucosamine N-acyltransferase [Paracoccus shanxieyensis]|uniref:UDP-3-O-acylglucosamine N-acyltransferase n=1 Tax=Paracoccus shanxieyensis TaxID=2675752 RepID=A0A6L6ISZ3_9RHOB|nr:UDP-3-O-(3-hydroxymyristoyl)glucosamine N-acyltransferase [Paracoccus shanxieyensis]MTH63615.1 UDP-3-O-(3-hydroxymyristoyl)glucosamine N-acyltransferase [Paracoccus shanxieyensis]MTH86537.1 UDP-3-O-(3-hydroxymyristoyl)glucosamine N-acyltransferase [Paracoccus shanxieyensis]